MRVVPLDLDGACIIERDLRRDDRGYFARVYDEALFEEAGLHRRWVQENESLSRRRGTIRGFHFQRPPHTETKLVRAGAGAVLDVIVDLRRASPTFGHWRSIELSSENGRLLLVPRGFAHAFCTLTDDALVLYKVDAAYAPAAEDGVLWSDPRLAVPWPVSDPVMSAKDQALPTLDQLESPF